MVSIEQMTRALGIANACYEPIAPMAAESRARLCASEAKRLRARAKQCTGALQEQYTLAAKMLATTGKCAAVGMAGKTA